MAGTELYDDIRTGYALADIATGPGADSSTPLPPARDFADGVFPVYWRRPTAYLDPASARPVRDRADRPRGRGTG